MNTAEDTLKKEVEEESLTNAGAWGVTDRKGHLVHGGSIERAKDIMWSMQNEDDKWKGKHLALVWCKWEEFNKPTIVGEKDLD